MFTFHQLVAPYIQHLFNELLLAFDIYMTLKTDENGPASWSDTVADRFTYGGKRDSLAKRMSVSHC